MVTNWNGTTSILPLSFGIGLFQALSLVPGVSRSGATIVGAMLLGTDKRSAAEFSFFLAMPTMAGAFTYDLLKNYKLMTFDNTILIAAGFASALLLAYLCVGLAIIHHITRGHALKKLGRVLLAMMKHAGVKTPQGLTEIRR